MTSSAVIRAGLRGPGKKSSRPLAATLDHVFAIAEAFNLDTG
jgi:hypothetical protein